MSINSETISKGPVGLSVPSSIQFSPLNDKNIITFLHPDDNGKRQVYNIDMTTVDVNNNSNDVVYNAEKLFDTSLLSGNLIDLISSLSI